MSGMKRILLSLALGAATLIGAQSATTEAQANKDDAFKILKSMSDFIGGQKALSVTFDASIEVITPQLEKIQYANSGQVVLARPDKLRASRAGGYAEVELVFDGKSATVHGKSINAYAQLDAPGTTDQLFDKLREELGMQIPGADLLFTDTFAVLTKDVIEAKHIGVGVVGGVECEHLAFRNDDTDWQIWVQAGAQPFPRKLVITTKSLAGAPQYVLQVREWKAEAPTSADAFTFKAPDGAKKVKTEELTDIDELPAGVARR